MSAQTIIHKSWCREHQTDDEGEHCFSGGFEFGPMKPAHDGFPPHRMGDVWAGQQLGVDDEPQVHLEYGIGGDIEMRVEDLLPLPKAIDRLIEVFGVEAPDPLPPRP
jgi:hypothetical protein